MICPDCDALCVATADKEKAERVERQRRRPLRDELGTVMSYPLRDPMAYIMMAVFVGIFSTAAKIAIFGGWFGVLFSTGLLYAYSFTAINRVSAGNTTSFMPEISDLSDLIKSVSLGVAVMIISKGPFLVLTIVVGVSLFSLIPGMGARGPDIDPEDLQVMTEGMTPDEIVEMQEQFGRAGDDSMSAPALGTALGAIVALPFALLWWILYAPIALIAAAISQSFFATLNPITGIDAIRRMGSIYWEAWVVYTGIAIVGGIGAVILGLVPLIGPFLAAFVQAYAYLSFGCLLGFAVFKRAKELGVD